MITQWIEACEVQRVSLDGGLVLNLEDHNELVITRPLRLSIPALEAHPAEDLIVDEVVALHGAANGLLSGAGCVLIEVALQLELALQFCPR